MRKNSTQLLSRFAGEGKHAAVDPDAVFESSHFTWG